MSAKDIILKPISSKIANEFVKTHHYSGKVVQNSQLHFGVFYQNQLGGVMSYWPSTDKSKLIDLVVGTKWNEFIELNRMAFSDFLPRNSESRAISVSFRLLKKYAPHIRWVISFADGCQCWDGTIYRASGFDLSQIKKNTGLRQDIDWRVYSQVTFSAHKPNEMENFRKMDRIPGFMLRYIKILRKEDEKFRNYPVLPYSKIQEIGAKMYKGEKQQ